VFYCRQIRIGNRYDEQLGDVLQILLAFYFLSLGDFGDFSQIMYFILILSTRKFYLVKSLINTYDFCNNHHPQLWENKDMEFCYRLE
jgi:hypothetical protein